MQRGRVGVGERNGNSPKHKEIEKNKIIVFIIVSRASGAIRIVIHLLVGEWIRFLRAGSPPTDEKFMKQ